MSEGAPAQLAQAAPARERPAARAEPETEPTAVIPPAPEITAAPEVLGQEADSIFSQIELQAAERLVEVRGPAMETRSAGQLADQTPAEPLRVKAGFWQNFLTGAENFYWLILWAAIVLLLMNIFIKIRIQHRSIILNGIVLIAVLSVALWLHIYYAADIGRTIVIFGL